MLDKICLQFQHLSSNRTHCKLCMRACMVIYYLLFIFAIVIIDWMTFENDGDQYERILSQRLHELQRTVT